MRVIGQVTYEEVLGQLANVDLVLFCTPVPHDKWNETTAQATNLIQIITADYPHIKIVAMGLPHQVPIILHYLESGVNGYVLNEDSTWNFLEKTRAAYNGQPSICPEVTAALMERVMELSDGQPSFTRQTLPLIELTAREREVLELMGYGLSNREIAQRLYIEVGTVKNHVHSILKKLDASDRYEATLYLPVLFEQQRQGKLTAASFDFSKKDKRN